MKRDFEKVTWALTLPQAAFCLVCSSGLGFLNVALMEFVDEMVLVKSENRDFWSCGGLWVFPALFSSSSAPPQPTPLLCLYLKTVTSQLFVFWFCFSLGLDKYKISFTVSLKTHGLKYLLLFSCSAC